MPQSFTGDRGRRRFIKTVVLSTGAVFLDWNRLADAAPVGLKPLTGSLDYRTAHAILRDNSRKIDSSGKVKDAADVIVVGGGLSGLSAAWRIKKAGRSVIVIENERAIGGAVRHDDAGGAEIGALRFQQPAGDLVALLADLGVTPVALPADGYWVDGRTTLHDLYSEETLRNFALAAGSPIAMRSFRNYLLAMDPKPSFPLHLVDESLITQYDMMQGTDIISAFPGAELADWLDVYSLSTFGRTLPKVNPYMFYASYQAQLGPTFEQSWYSFANGMRALPEAMEKKLGDAAILRSTLAARVEQDKNSATVTVVRGDTVERLRAKAVVVATQKRVAQRLVADLPGVQQFRMKSIPLSSAITVQIHCSSPLVAERSFMVWFRDPERRIAFLHDASYLDDFHHGALDRSTGTFVYTVPCLPGDTDPHSLEDNEWLVRFAQRIVAALSEYMPHVYDVATELRVFAWGHAVASALPGMIGQLYAHTSEPFGRVFFAGSDNDLCSNVESAIGSGLNAAEGAIAV